MRKEPSVKDRNFWQEFDSAAEWSAKRGYRGKIGDPLPEFISARLARYINEYPEGFANRVSDFLKVPRSHNPRRKPAQPWKQRRYNMKMTIYKNGIPIQSKSFAESSQGVGESQRFSSFMEKRINEYLRDNKKSHFGIVLISPKYGNSVDEFYFEDAVNPAYLKKFDAVHGTWAIPHRIDRRNPRNPGSLNPRLSIPRLNTDNTRIDTWEERDRLWIALRRKSNDDILFEWWDEDAAEMFEDGYFEPRDMHGSVLRYLWDMGIARR
jgi:hypothetical protein